MENLAAHHVKQKDLSHRLIDTTFATLYKQDLSKAPLGAQTFSQKTMAHNYIEVESYVYPIMRFIHAHIKYKLINMNNTTIHKYNVTNNYGNEKSHKIHENV